MIKDTDGYLFTGFVKPKLIVKVRPFSSAKTPDMSDYIKPTKKGLQSWYLRLSCWNKRPHSKRYICTNCGTYFPHSQFFNPNLCGLFRGSFSYAYSWTYFEYNHILFWSVGIGGNLMTSPFFAKVPKNSHFWRHFQFYPNILQNTAKISLEKVIRLYNG